LQRLEHGIPCVLFSALQTERNGTPHKLKKVFLFRTTKRKDGSNDNRSEQSVSSYSPCFKHQRRRFGIWIMCNI